MSLRFGKYAALLALVAFLQTGVLLKMVFDRQRLLNTGREITMQVQPVDPRDLFRGDYVMLGYGLSPVIMSELSNGAPLTGIEQGHPVFVTIHAAADNTWTVNKLSAAYPATVPPGDAVLKGLVQYRSDRGENVLPAAKPGDIQFTVKYGIESFFVPEGSGKDIQDNVRDHKTQAVIAVAADGTAAIKALIIDGERHQDPPLF